MYLWRSILNPKAREAWKHTWILAPMWRLVDERVSERWEPAREHALIQRLGHAINARLRDDRRRQTEEAGEAVERFLGTEPPPPGRLALDEGEVLGCGQPGAVAYSG